MAVNKVVLNGQTQIDLSQDSVTEEDVAAGVTFHKSNGMIAVGTRSTLDSDVNITQETGDSTSSVMSQKAVTDELLSLDTRITKNASDIELLKTMIGDVPEDMGDKTLTEYVAEEVTTETKSYVDEQISTLSLDGGEL